MIAYTLSWIVVALVFGGVGIGYWINNSFGRYWRDTLIEAIVLSTIIGAHTAVFVFLALYLFNHN
jgi:ABC-type nitrate/sulfonate/bicarbonate transport system permease component